MPDPLFTKPALSRSDALDTERVDPTVNLAADMHDGFRRTADSLAEQVSFSCCTGASAGTGLQDVFWVIVLLLQSQTSTAIAREMNTHSAIVLQGPAALTQTTGEHASADPFRQQAMQYWRHAGPTSLEDLRYESPALVN